MNRNCELEAVLEGYLLVAEEQVRGGLVSDQLEVHAVRRKAEAVVNQLELAEREDDTPELLVLGDVPSVKWRVVLDGLSEKARLAATAPGARKKRVTEGERVGPAIVRCEQVRRRLVQAITGNHSRPDDSSRLREALLGHRPVPRNKAGWEDELKTIIAGIEHLERCGEAPVALRALRPQLLVALEELDASQPAVGRPRSTAVRWEEAPLVSATALNLALGQVLSWAAVWAKPRRNAALLKLIVPPPRRVEVTPAAPAPAEGAASAPAAAAAPAPASAPSAPAPAAPAAASAAAPAAGAGAPSGTVASPAKAPDPSQTTPAQPPPPPAPPQGASAPATSPSAQPGGAGCAPAPAAEKPAPSESAPPPAAAAAPVAGAATG